MPHRGGGPAWRRLSAQSPSNGQAAAGAGRRLDDQFLIVDRHFVESLGLDPEDPDWAAIGFNWVVPSDPLARIRLYSRLINLKR